MIRTYENGCKHYKPTLRLVCSVLSLTISLCEFTLAIYEYSFSRGGNIVATIFACLFSFHGCITFLYFIGVLRRNPCFQVPFLTLQLIFMTSLGLLVVVWWIATLLAAFDLVHYRSPIENLTNCEFFMAAGGVLLVLFILWMKISLVLYRGYVRTEREAHYRRRLSCGLQLSRSCARDCPSIYDDNCNGLTLLIPPCKTGQTVMAAVMQVGTAMQCQQTATCPVDEPLYYYTASRMPGVQVAPDAQVLCNGNNQWFISDNPNTRIIGVSCASDPGTVP